MADPELGLKSSYCLSQSCSQSPYHGWIWARFIWTNDQTIEIEEFNPASRRLHLKPDIDIIDIG